MDARHREELSCVVQDAALHEAEEVEKALAQERLRSGTGQGCGGRVWRVWGQGCGGKAVGVGVVGWERKGEGRAHTHACSKFLPLHVAGRQAGPTT